MLLNKVIFILTSHWVREVLSNTSLAIQEAYFNDWELRFEYFHNWLNKKL